jgi:drug/metabolite transporter (DMT)-like permease
MNPVPAAAKALSLTAFLTLLLIAFMMGTNHVAARLAFNNGLDVATAVACRSIVTALVVSAIVLFAKVPRTLNAKQWRGVLAVGLLIGLQSQLLYGAVARLPVALALIAFNTFPLWTALWERVAYGKRPERITLLAMPIILFGLCLALDVFGAATNLGAGSHWQQIGAGVAFGIAAAAVFGMALVLMQHETAGVDGRVRTAGTMYLAGAMALAVIGMQGGAHWPTAAVGWAGLAGLTILYGTAFTIMFTVLPKLGVGSAAAIMNVEPVFALAMAWWVLGQTIEPIQIVGALVVVGTVVVLGLRKQ